MFLQVGLLKDDRAYHLFLSRNLDASREPDVYEFQRLMFGNTASPFCAQFIVQKHVKDKVEHYPIPKLHIVFGFPCHSAVGRPSSRISRPGCRSSSGTSSSTDLSFDDHFRSRKLAEFNNSESCLLNSMASLEVSHESRTSSTYMELLTVSIHIQRRNTRDQRDNHEERSIKRIFNSV